MAQKGYILTNGSCVLDASCVCGNYDSCSIETARRRRIIMRIVAKLEEILHCAKN